MPEVIVTGGTGALGRALVHAYLERGDQVVVPWVLVHERDAVAELWAGRPVTLVEADIAEENGARSVADAAPACEALVNAAGGFSMAGDVDQTPLELWDALYRMNLRTAVAMSRAVLPGMRRTIPLNSPTPASLRDIAVTGGVVQLDTVERWKDKDSYAAVMEFLDAGFRNGGTVVKMVPLPKGDWVRREYPVYTPCILAGIDKNSLTDTALDRSFPITMHRKPISVRKKKYHSFKCDEECAPVRDDLYIWALQKAEEVALMDELGSLEAQINELALNDRAVDIWKPLFTVLFVLGFEEDSKEWADLSSLAVDMHQDKELAELETQIAILGALQEKAKGDTVLSIV